MKALLTLMAEQGIASPVQLQKRPMSQVNVALDDLARGHIAGRVLAIAGQ
ncbi:hypothetical protein ACTMU2_15635 [Cupriavidus basilensis]